MTSKKTLMFIDDDRDFLGAQAAFFKARGYTVLTAEGGEQALSLLEREKPDLIFLDLMMEHYDSGFVLGNKIRRNDRFKDVPLVMLSGVAQATGCRFDQEGSNLREWSKLDQFVDKPVTGKQLLRIVEEKLGRQVTG